MADNFAKMIERKPEGAIFFGDWHGDLTFAIAALERAISKYPDITVYYHVGDFGIWPGDDAYISTIVSMMQSSGKTLVVTGGNHEDWDKWDRLTAQQTRPFTYKGGGLVLLPKKYFWTHAGVTFASVGGAGSIDKQWRVEGKSWWPQEIISDDVVNEVEEGDVDQVDILITHEASDDPVFPVRKILENPFVQMKWPHEDIVISEEQRKLVSRVIAKVKPKVHLHGHWHEPWQRDAVDCKTVSLGANFASYAENAHVISDFSKLRG